MSTTARECDIADAVAAYINTLWTTKGAQDGVQRVWVANIGLDPSKQAELIQGRQVFVLPVTHATPEWMARAVKKNQYTIVVLIAERYTGDGLIPPNSWVDPIVLFGEQTIFYPLGDPNNQLVGTAGVVTDAYADPEVMPTVDVLIDRERLLQNGTVFIQYTFVFQDRTDRTGASV